MVPPPPAMTAPAYPIVPQGVPRDTATMDATTLPARNGLNGRPDERPVPLASPTPSGVPTDSHVPAGQGPARALRGGHQTRPGYETAPRMPGGQSMTPARAAADHMGLQVETRAPSAALKAVTTGDAVAFADALAERAGLGGRPGR